VSTGWPAVHSTCLKLKIVFDPWQDGAGRAILGKRSDGLYAADAVVISIPRQVGKTFLIGAIIFALSIINPGTLALWTAHRYVTAADTFNDMKSLAQRAELAPHVARVLTGTGNQSIEFHNGSRILFGARERGFGRGFKKVGILVFDEAQILGQNAIDDMVPATNRATNPLIIYLGTPPKPSDPSDVFTNLRKSALDGESEDTFYLEFSADENASPTDREQWAKANPSYPAHTPARSILRMRKNMTPESFLREALGIWDGTATVGVFAAGAWARRATKVAPPEGVAALGIAADLDQVWLSLGAASEGDKRHLGAVKRVRADEHRAEFVADVFRIQTERQCVVAIDKKGPASFLIPDLEATGVQLTMASIDDFVQASADIKAAVEGGTVTHSSNPALDAAVDAAGWRKVGGDRRTFARRSGDISMLEAVTLALWGAQQNTESIYESRGMVTL
jgi:phage terminase large subunit-like protein